MPFVRQHALYHKIVIDSSFCNKFYPCAPIVRLVIFLLKLAFRRANARLMLVCHFSRVLSPLYAPISLKFSTFILFYFILSYLKMLFYLIKFILISYNSISIYFPLFKFSFFLFYFILFYVLLSYFIFYLI